MYLSGVGDHFQVLKVSEGTKSNSTYVRTYCICCTYVRMSCIVDDVHIVHIMDSAHSVHDVHNVHNVHTLQTAQTVKHIVHIKKYACCTYS